MQFDLVAFVGFIPLAAYALFMHRVTEIFIDAKGIKKLRFVGRNDIVFYLGAFTIEHRDAQKVRAIDPQAIAASINDRVVAHFKIGVERAVVRANHGAIAKGLFAVVVARRRKRRS